MDIFSRFLRDFSVDEREVLRAIKFFLEEDKVFDDITSSILDGKCRGFFLAKERFLLAGVPVVKRIFNMFGIKVKVFRFDGEFVRKGEKIMEVYGDARRILSLERVCLNLLQNMSGVATETRKIVDIAKKYSVGVYATRKTTPGMRIFQKYAVFVGGGNPYRMNLSDGIMVKDNHLRICNLELNKMKKWREKRKEEEIVKKRKFEIVFEAQNMRELLNIISYKPDVIMLDNFLRFGEEKLREAIYIVRKHGIKVEVSGGITRENFKKILKLKPDRISVGYITHSARSVDISFECEKIK